MATPYLIEVRTGGEVKQDLQNVIYDVADRFDVQGAAKPRAVPHITLFGPYNTDRGREVKETVQDVLSGFDVVPYRIEGFGRFPENKVIYAKVIPSPELRELRRELSRQLRPLTYNYRSYDSDYFHDFHITIAFKDVDTKFDDVWQYVNEEYDLGYDEYATRITSLRRRQMLWEYDLLQGQELRPDDTTLAESWQRTTELLDERSSPEDHRRLVQNPDWLTRLLKTATARATFRW